MNEQSINREIDTLMILDKDCQDMQSIGYKIGMTVAEFEVLDSIQSKIQKRIGYLQDQIESKDNQS